MHKTGTSSIQDSFAAVPPEGFSYFKARGNNLNQWSRVMFEEPETLMQLPWYSQASDAERQAFRKARAEESDREFDRVAAAGVPVIFSAERFGYMSEPSVARFRGWLAERFEEVEIHAYVRDPLGFVRSSIQQRIKTGAKDLSVTPDLPHYQSRFAKFEDAFGADHVQYRIFRRGDLKDGNVVADFADWLGTGYPVEAILTSNESVSVEALACMIAMTCHLPDDIAASVTPVERIRTFALLTEFGSGTFAFSEAAATKIVASIKADCDWMDARLGTPLDRTARQSGDVTIDRLEDLAELAPDYADGLRAHIAAALVPDAPRSMQDLLPALSFVRYAP
ncbi:hypothetical protein ATO11_18350 [Pseudaestuariivita atlantica]|uniref:Sulfotransferase domain-containing protein n=2 Tax=Pseudaestuariivita atlantica TaxID=1317121 RepID=A0A0L1JKD8_9RHOB|nr:hypothetical protein ATO11_18350 [Pseudaestuariivita atlantica]